MKVVEDDSQRRDWLARACCGGTAACEEAAELLFFFLSPCSLFTIISPRFLFFLSFFFLVQEQRCEGPLQPFRGGAVEPSLGLQCDEPESPVEAWKVPP